MNKLSALSRYLKNTIFSEKKNRLYAAYGGSSPLRNLFLMTKCHGRRRSGELRNRSCAFRLGTCDNLMSDVGRVLNDRACYDRRARAMANRQLARSKVSFVARSGSRGVRRPRNYIPFLPPSRNCYIREKANDGGNDREFTNTQPLRYAHLRPRD